MAPEIEQQINGYLFKWPEYELAAKVSRCRQKSDGQINGELEIQHRNGSGEWHYCLAPTSFNFSSETTRSRTAKQLSEKLDLQIEWKEIFDYLGVKVQELTRAGDVPIEVFTEDDAPPPEQLLGQLIYKGVQNIIFGEKGTLKSTTCYLLGMCVTLPWHDNPFGLTVPSQRVNVLVLDWETDENIFRYYMSRLHKGMNIPICSLHYRRCTLPLIADIEALQKHIESTKATVLIIDSLGAAAGGERGELKGSEAALLFNTAMRKLNCTSLIIGQTSKTDENKKTLYGSTFFRYYARNIFELCQGEDDYGDVQHLALFHRDCNLGRRTSPMGLRVEFNQATDGIKFEREPVSVLEFTQKVSASMRILEELKQGAKTQKQLTEALDESYQTIHNAIRRLSNQGKVRKIDDTWGLVAL